MTWAEDDLSIDADSCDPCQRCGRTVHEAGAPLCDSCDPPPSDKPGHCISCREPILAHEMPFCRDCEPHYGEPS